MPVLNMEVPINTEAYYRGETIARREGVSLYDKFAQWLNEYIENNKKKYYEAVELAKALVGCEQGGGAFLDGTLEVLVNGGERFLRVDSCGDVVGQADHAGDGASGSGASSGTVTSCSSPATASQRPEGSTAMPRGCSSAG